MEFTFGQNYQIINKSGQGGIAETYTVYDQNVDRQVVIKVLSKLYSENELFRKRFLREAKIMAKLQHRSILPIYDFGEIEETKQLFLVMPQMPDSLRRRLSSEGPLPLKDANLIIEQLAGALTLTHKQGIVHNDIKPSNVLLDEDGYPYLVDFGLAHQVMEESEMDTGDTIDWYRVAGTPAYMAPEQWRGEAPTTQTDIYHLGVVLFEMLTGQRPFTENDTQRLRDRHINESVPDIRNLDPWLPSNIQSIIEKAMAKNPRDRFGTPKEMAQAVAKLLNPERINYIYEIKEELQHNRTSMVYFAHNLQTGEGIVLKLLSYPLLINLKFKQQFTQEAKSIVKLEHQAIISIYDVGRHEDKPYFVMPYISGRSLFHFLNKGKILSFHEVCDIAHRLAGAIDAAHIQGILHRDIRPHNVLIDEKNSYYLSDFGIQYILQQTEAILETEDINIDGFPYRAPEQWKGEDLTNRTDIYQFGTMLFEMLTGRPPFVADTPDEYKNKHLTSPIPKVQDVNTDVPDNFDNVLSIAMAKDAINRYATATELATDLSKAYDEFLLKEKAETFNKGIVEYDRSNWQDAIKYFEQIIGYHDADFLRQKAWENQKIEEIYEAGVKEYRLGKWENAREIIHYMRSTKPYYENAGELRSKVNELWSKIENKISEQPVRENNSIIYAVARIKDNNPASFLEVEKHFILQAGIKPYPIEGFTLKPITIPEYSHEIMFHIMVHAEDMILESDRIQLFTLRRNEEVPLVEFILRPVLPGKKIILIEFLHKNHWLTKLEIEVDVIQKLKTESIPQV